MSMYVEATAGAVEHCETMSNMYEDLSETYKQISQYCNTKLWHQLTLKILEIVKDPTKYLRTTSDGTNSFLALYDKVVCCVDKKLNSLSLAIIAVHVSNSLLDGTSGEEDGMAAKTILENLLEKKQQLGIPATIYVESKLALLNLKLLEKNIILASPEQPKKDGGDDSMKVDDTTDDETKKTKLLNSIKEMLKKNAQTLSEMIATSITDSGSSSIAVDESAIVQSAHYECSMTYRKVVGPPELYYREAISYLNYTPIDTLSKENKFQIATDISLAALTGDGVFSFGEVITTPILEELRSTPNEYLIELMYISSKGDVPKFQTVTQKYEKQIAAQPALVNRSNVVKEKITLLALVNMIFERSSSERTITFDEIKDRIYVEKDQVELVIMRALSLKLIKGSIDEVDETLQVTDVMSRVLDNDQIVALSTKFGEWAVKVSKTKDYMKEQIINIQ